MNGHTGVWAVLLTAGTLCMTVLAAEAQDTARQFDSGLLGVFAPERWQRIQITVNRGNTGELHIDPNRGQWNGYSPNWVSTLMADQVLNIRLVPVHLREALTVFPNDLPKDTAVLIRDLKEAQGKAKPAYRMRLFEINPAGDTQGIFENVKWRLALSDDPTAAARLLLLEKDRISQVILLEAKRSGSGTKGAATFDLLSHKTGFLGGKLDRLAFIGLTGSVSSGTVQITMDSNLVVLNALGIPTIMTMRMPLAKEARLVEKTDIGADVSAVWRVFSLEGALRPMTLVLPKNPMTGTARLVLNDEQGRGIGFQVLERDYRFVWPLVRDTWRLDKITYSDDKVIVPEKRGDYTLQFSPDGRITGRTNVNRIMGSYTVAGINVQFGITASTRAAANPTVEYAFRKALSQVDSFKIQGNELWLMLKADSGTIVLKREGRQ